MGSTAFMLIHGLLTTVRSIQCWSRTISTSIIPYGTCLPEAKGFTACSQGLSEATPLENAPYDASRQGCQQRFSFVGDDDRCDERR